MARRLEVGGLDSLNAAPLQWGLARGRAAAARPLRLTLRTPAASAQALISGAADVALIPSIELPRIRGARLVPGIAVAARRRVRSVVLLTRSDPAELASVAVDETSRTSVALLRILLARRFGATPRLVPRPADAGAMMAEHDGALLIADAALAAPSGRWQAHDLAAMWAAWTGLPFVFAVWAIRPDADPGGLAELLLDSRAEGLDHLATLVAERAGRDGAPGGPALTAYLSELLHYTLGTEEEASMARFFSEARDLGLLPAAATAAAVGPRPARAATGRTG